jgi:predicted nucleic acid-binding protein
VLIFLDTSVLIPVFLGDHPHHSASIALFSSCEPATARCAAHSLAELYSTLTRLPASHRASPDKAIECVEKIAARFTLVSLDGPSYLAAIQHAASQRVVGGTTYDSLIATCALNSGADRIYSWNTRHFEKLGPDVASRLSMPPSS